MKKQIRAMKLNRETVRALTSDRLVEVAGGYVQTAIACSQNGHTCVASCSDVPCN
jgi:hypothetical protein